MMRAAVTTILALSAAAASAESPVFHPGAVTLFDVEARDPAALALIRDELRTVGLIQITQVPGLQALRAEVLRESSLCGAQSAAALTSLLPDGGQRRTLATAPGSDFTHGAGAADACARFDAASAEFRALVGRASTAFAAAVNAFTPRASFLERVGAVDAADAVYDSFAALAEHATQLEHFHSYTAGASTTQQRAVDLHVDQGLFIAFVPALMVGGGDADAAKFTVQLPGGSEVEAQFSRDGAVVFMLGDGVDQHVNPHLAEDARMRAAPHALQLPGGATLPRAWYGRMFLPPADAASAAHGGMAFADARKQDIAAALGEDVAQMSLGCSGGMVARELQQSSCEANQLWCWHRCQNFTDTVNVTACAAEGLEAKCTNADNDKLWVDASGHSSQFQPRCTSATEIFVAPTNAPTAAPSAAPTSGAASSTPGFVFAAAALASLARF